MYVTGLVCECRDLKYAVDEVLVRKLISIDQKGWDCGFCGRALPNCMSKECHVCGHEWQGRMVEGQIPRPGCTANGVFIVMDSLGHQGAEVGVGSGGQRARDSNGRSSYIVIQENGPSTSSIYMMTPCYCTDCALLMQYKRHFAWCGRGFQEEERLWVAEALPN